MSRRCRPNALDHFEEVFTAVAPMREDVIGVRQGWREGVRDKQPVTDIFEATCRSIGLRRKY